MPKNDDAFDPDNEVAMRTPSGEFVVVENAAANKGGTSYVRLVTSLGEDGKEVVYWNEDEWRDAPAEVMGAIFGAILKDKGVVANNQVPKTRAIVEVEGGLVSNVYSTDPNLDVSVLDRDVEGAEDAAEREKANEALDAETVNMHEVH